MKNLAKMSVTILLLWTFLPPLSFAASPEIRKWKDGDSNIFFSDTPPWAGMDIDLRGFNEESVPIGKPRPDITPLQSRKEALKEKRPYGNIVVIMYMTPWWGYCRKAREYLQALDVNLIEYNVEKDSAKRDEMLRKSGGSRGVPLIDVEGIIIRGYNPGAMKDAIEKRRGP